MVNVHTGTLPLEDEIGGKLGSSASERGTSGTYSNHPHEWRPP